MLTQSEYLSNQQAISPKLFLGATHGSTWKYGHSLLSLGKYQKVSSASSEGWIATLSQLRALRKYGKTEAYDFSQKTFNSGLVKIRVRRQMVNMHKIFYTVEEHSFFAK